MAEVAAHPAVVEQFPASSPSARSVGRPVSVWGNYPAFSHPLYGLPSPHPAPAPWP
jgi:hypothetical protein